MSRLLFAAARGARIQQDVAGGWHPTRMVTANADDPINETKPCRIHPDDAHLAYGPISTKLREFAAGNSSRPEDDTYWRIARDYFICAAGVHYYILEERSLFLLILAESLADEGL